MKIEERERQILNNWPMVTEADIELMNDEFPHYIFFRRRKDGGAEYFTSCCGKRHTLEGIRRTDTPEDRALLAASIHNGLCDCPWCGRGTTMKDLARAGKRKSLEANRCVLLLHDQDGALYADALVLNKRYRTEDELTARPCYWVSSGYRFAPGEVMQADYQYWGCDEDPYITWERGKLSSRKQVQEPFNVGYISFCRYEPYSVLNRCELEDSPALRYCQYFSGWDYRPFGPRGYPHKCDDFVSYLTAYCIYPRQIEMLVKAGLYQPVEALVYQRKKFAAAIRWEEPDVRKAMGLTKQELRQVIALQPDFGALECRNYANRHLNAGWSIPDAMDFWNLFWQLDDRMAVLRMCRKYRLDVNRLVRYLAEFTETIEGLRMWDAYELYRDYIDAAWHLGRCMEHSRVLWPEDLIAAHDTATDQWAAAQDAQAEKKDARKIKDAKGRKSKYEFELDGLRIVFPLSSAAIKREGQALNHCVGGYAERHIRGVLSIVFLRKAATPHVPYVTIEMRGNQIQQIHGESNDLHDSIGPRRRHKEFLDTWLRWLQAGSPRNEDGTPKISRPKKQKEAAAS